MCFMEIESEGVVEIVHDVSLRERKMRKGNKLHITDKYLCFVHIPVAMKHSLKCWRE